MLNYKKRSKTHKLHSGGEGPTMVLGFDMYRPNVDSVDKDEGELSEMVIVRCGKSSKECN